MKVEVRKNRRFALEEDGDVFDEYSAPFGLDDELAEAHIAAGTLKEYEPGSLQERAEAALSDEDYRAARSVLSDAGVVPESQQKDDVFKALEEYLDEVD